MLHDGGCNRKSTLLDLKDDDDIVLKFTPEWSLYSLVRCTPISVCLFSDITKNHNKFTVFKIFFKIFCYYCVDIIVIAGI